MHIQNLFKNILFFMTLLVPLIVLSLITPRYFKFATLNRSEVLIKKNKLSPTLNTLLQLTNLDHTGSDLQSIVDITQKNWLRKPDQERWDIEEKYDQNKTEFVQLFNKLNLLNEIYPTKKRYTYAVLFGAAIYRIRTRIRYLIDLYNQGVRFDHIIVLGSHRPLNPTIESPHILMQPNIPGLPFNTNWQKPSSIPTTEIDMIRLVFDQTDLPFDRNLIQFIETPMLPISDIAQHTAYGAMRRATTEDTIHTWLDTKPVPGHCLLISNQPFVAYQDAVARTYIPNSFFIETVGEGITKEERKNLKISVTLDNIARWLYQLNQLEKNYKET